MKPELIIFDLDDTLMAFGVVVEEAWDKAIRLFAKKFNLNKNILFEKLSETRKWYWNDPEKHKIGRENIIGATREIVKIALKEYTEIETNALENLADDYNQIHKGLWHLFDDVEETIKNIKKNKIKLGIMTNGTSEGQREKLRHFHIEKYFDYIYIEGEIGYGKPDIRVFEYMLQDTKIESTKIIMVGDNLIWDIKPAQKLGIYTLWINTKNLILENYDIRPDKTIRRISDINELIK